jgi:hypothetical protein
VFFRKFLKVTILLMLLYTEHSRQQTADSRQLCQSLDSLLK